MLCKQCFWHSVKKLPQRYLTLQDQVGKKNARDINNMQCMAFLFFFLQNFISWYHGNKTVHFIPTQNCSVCVNADSLAVDKTIKQSLLSLFLFRHFIFLKFKTARSYKGSKISRGRVIYCQHHTMSWKNYS